MTMMMTTWGMPKLTKRREKFQPANTRPALLPLTERQGDYIQALWQSPQVIVLGPAGTGKTFVGATYAADLLMRHTIRKIVLTRPNVASGRSIGFFPGSLEEKMAPWMAPVIDVITQRMGKAVVDIAIKNGSIDVVPFETMRGRSFNDSFVILDEAQNTSPEEMKMFLTRIGDNTKVIINGDVSQSDLRQTSGLSTAIHMAKKYMLPVPIIEFGTADIVRSELCRLWIEAFIAEEKK